MNSSLLEDLKRNPTALVLAVGLHLLILVAALVNFSFRPADVPAASQQPVNIVQAEAIDARDFDQSLKKHQQVEQNKRKQAEAARRKKEETRKKAEQAKKQKAEEQKRIALQKKQEAEKRKKADEAKRQEEQKRKAAEDKRKAEEARKKKEAEQRKQAEAKAEQERMAAMLAAEEAEIEERRAAAARAEQERQQAIYNRRLAQLKQSYIGAIQSHVTSHWRRPSDTEPGNKAEVYITQAPGGYIISVRVESCTGSAAFCKSVEAAVLRSEPLPQPSEKALFDRDIRFTFRP